MGSKTAWKTSFTISEIEKWRESVKDEDLKSRIDIMIECLGMCITNEIIVTMNQDNAVEKIEKMRYPDPGSEPEPKEWLIRD